MAGSWNHLVDRDGVLADDRLGTVENLGDAAEAFEECYGMVWQLAWSALSAELGANPSREQVLERIEQARQAYGEGVELGTGAGPRW